jgi:hypothetical protein
MLNLMVHTITALFLKGVHFMTFPDKHIYYDLLSLCIDVFF